VPTENNNQTGTSQPADPLAAQSEQSETSTSARQQNSADAQIQAHRKQHQQQKTKLFGGAGVFAALALLLVAAYYLFTSESSDRSNEVLTPSEVVMSQSQIAQFREDFKQAITQYEMNVQPNIDEIMLTDWEPAKASELALIKEQAVTAFAQGTFMLATQAIENLDKKSKGLIAQWQIQIQQHVNDGKQAFDSEQIPQAQLFVNKALLLSSTNIDALNLQNRIYAHGEVSKLVDDLAVAVFENDWNKQVQVITGIIELDPQRTELNDDLKHAKTQDDNEQLAQYLAQAEIALQAKQLSRAQQLVTQAQTIKPNSRGAQALSSRINEIKAQQSLSSVKRSVKSAVDADNWVQVNALVVSTLQKYPNDADLRNYQAQVQQVLSAKKSLATFVRAPQRLADDNIREAASKAVQSAFSASLLSPSLQRQIEQVATGIDQYNNPVEVHINSNGKTYIVVLGVGHVGEHEQKIISLTPGKYVLQGKREGYRNKRLEFTVNANTPLSLTLICDEPI
jgi:hypothetical protein